MSKIIAAQNKRDKTSYNGVFYLFDKDSMQDLVRRLKDGDEIIIHGEGQPFVLGIEEPSPYDLTAYRLAQLLSENNLPDMRIDITLLSCNSGSTWLNTEARVNFNFARDLSKALHVVHDYTQLSVTGYKGLVVVKGKSGKFSVCGPEEQEERAADKITPRDRRKPHANIPHASLDETKVVYENGQLMNQGPMGFDISRMAFGWAGGYIKKAHEGNLMVQAMEQRQLRREVEQARQAAASASSAAEHLSDSEDSVKGPKGI